MRLLTLLGYLMVLTLTANADVTSHAAPVVNQNLATQIALDRIGFSPGEIDGQAGRNPAARARGVSTLSSDPRDRADERRHEGSSLARQAATYHRSSEYVTTDSDVAGPFTPTIPANLPDQAALDALGYRTPLEALAERFHSSPALLKQLNPDAMFRAGEHLMVPNVITPSASSATPGATGTAGSIPGGDITVVVTKSTSALTIEDRVDAVLFHAPVTSGSTHDPLPIGTWKVNGVQRNPKFHYNRQLFWDSHPGRPERRRCTTGPNNPRRHRLD
jgi:hypothetical protein